MKTHGDSAWLRALELLLELQRQVLRIIELEYENERARLMPEEKEAPSNPRGPVNRTL